MSKVDTRHDPEAGVVLFIVRGRVTFEAMHEAGASHFMRHGTPDAVWDMRRADLSGLSVDVLKHVAAQAKDVAASRQNPRTAIVVEMEADMLLLRLYDALAERRQSPIVYEMFHDLESAWAWLGVDNPFPDWR